MSHMTVKVLVVSLYHAAILTIYVFLRKWHAECKYLISPLIYLRVCVALKKLH